MYEDAHKNGLHDSRIGPMPGCALCARRERRIALHQQRNQRRPAVIVQRIHAASLR